MSSKKGGGGLGADTGGGPNPTTPHKPPHKPNPMQRAASTVDSLAMIEERLGSLCDSISADVVPGLERELGKVRGWLAMLDAQSGSGGGEAKSPSNNAAADNEAERRKQAARRELETIATAVEVFKTALGSLYVPRRSGSF